MSWAFVHRGDLVGVARVISTMVKRALGICLEVLRMLSW